MRKQSEWLRGLLWAETMHEQGRGGEAYQHSVLGRDMDGSNDFDRGIQDYFRHIELIPTTRKPYVPDYQVKS